MPNVQEIYEQSRRTLTPLQRFALATLLLKDIPPYSIVDYSTEWSDEGLQDFTRAGQLHIERMLELEGFCRV